MNMKRLLCLILATILSLLCCSCAGKNNETSDDVQLTYWYHTEQYDEMVDVIQRYNRWCTSHSTDDMKIRLVEFEDFNTMSQRLNIEVMSGGGPDLFSNYMNLPFEKLMQNGAFRDLNPLIESDPSPDRIILNDYNQTIMDAAVFDGKRYGIPAFYTVDTLVGQNNVFEKYKMPTEQGYHLTFDNMDEVFSAFLQEPDGYYFWNDQSGYSGANTDLLILKLIGSRVDFDTKSTSFDEDFKHKLQTLMTLKEHSAAPSADQADFPFPEDIIPCLFSDYGSFSNPIWMERMWGSSDEDDFDTSQPVFYSCFEKDENTYSAEIRLALFVNVNTKKDEKVLSFIKYLIGEHLQKLYAGSEDEYWSGWGDDSLPVLNSAYESCVRTAYNTTDEYGEKNGVKAALSPVTQALLTYHENINSVSLYPAPQYSYYIRNIVLPILQDYRDGKIDLNKCADRLSSATRIYIEE